MTIKCFCNCIKVQTFDVVVVTGIQRFTGKHRKLSSSFNIFTSLPLFASFFLPFFKNLLVSCCLGKKGNWFKTFLAQNF